MLVSHVNKTDDSLVHQIQETVAPAAKWVNKKLNHPVVKLSKIFIGLAKTITNLATSIISQVSPSFLKANNSLENASGHLKKFIFLDFLSMPAVGYNLVNRVSNLGNAILGKASKNQTIASISKAALQVIQSIKDLIDIPGKVVGVIRLFTPLTHVTWVPILGLVSAVLSLATFIHSVIVCHEANQFVQNLKTSSHRAFIEELLKLSQIPENKKLKELIGDIDLESSLAHRIDKELELLALGGEGRLKAIVKEIKNCGVGEEVLEQLKNAADLAYIKCLKEENPNTLRGRFEIKGEKIHTALNTIIEMNSPKETSRIKGILAGRLKERQFFGRLSAVMNLVSSVATVILSVTALATSLSPIAPVGLALFLGLGLFSLINLYVNYENKEQFKRDLDIYTLN